ncbi:MAG: YfhO family protein [Chloroflexi bacterium]|nr:YfhO family protein [Chloroflexota bacterium]
MPDGPYGYTGHRVTTQPTRDAGASAFQTEPLNRLASRMWKAGQLPLWNPYAGLGVPLAANMQSGAFYPLSLLTALAPDNLWVWVSDALTLLGFLTAGLFTFLFLRSIGVGPPGAAGSAAAYMFCGYLLYFLGTADWRVDVLVPLLVFGSERLYARRSRGSGLLVAAGVMLSITAGMPEASLFALLVAGLYYVYRAFAAGLASRQTIRDSAVALLPFAAAAGLGIALSAYLTIPFVEYLRLSWNSHPPGVGLQSIPFDGAISLIVPNFFGNVLPSWFNPYPSDLWGTLPYIGGVTALLALFAIARGAGTNRQSYFWIAISAAFLLKAFGVPVVNLLGNLPLLDLSVFPRFAVAPFMFATAVLAGIGIDNLQQRRIGWVRELATAAAVLAVIAAFTLYYWPRAEAAGKTGFLVTQVAVEAAFVVLALLAFLLARYRVLSARTAAVALVGLVVLDLYAASPKDRSTRYDPFTEPPFVASLLQDHAPFRTLGLDYVLYPDTAGVYGIQDLKDLDAVYPTRLTTFLQRFVDPIFKDRFTGINVLDNKFLDLLNVQYLVTKYPLMDRWQSADLTEKIIQACASPPGCPEFQLGRDGTDPVLQVGSPSGRWSSTIVAPVELPQSRVWLRFDIGATGGPPVDGVAPGRPRANAYVAVAKSAHSRISTHGRRPIHHG